MATDSVYFTGSDVRRTHRNTVLFSPRSFHRLADLLSVSLSVAVEPPRSCRHRRGCEFCDRVLCALNFF